MVEPGHMLVYVDWKKTRLIPEPEPLKLPPQPNSIDVITLIILTTNSEIVCDHAESMHVGNDKLFHFARCGLSCVLLF